MRRNNATVDIGLRIKEALRGRIERAARINGLSMNAEINRRLYTSFDIENIFALVAQRERQTEPKKIRVK